MTPDVPLRLSGRSPAVMPPAYDLFSTSTPGPATPPVGEVVVP
jgi:hypothetical protein